MEKFVNIRNHCKLVWDVHVNVFFFFLSSTNYNNSSFIDIRKYTYYNTLNCIGYSIKYSNVLLKS